MEDDDPVIQEIPVFLSQSLSDNLYVYQYPVKPSSRDWNSSNVVKARVKPNNQLVRLEVAVDTYSDTYCYSKGEQIALNTDGRQEGRGNARDRTEPLYFRSGLMDKLVYESVTPGADGTQYAVAILQSNELHCTPIKGMIQLRPKCTYLDVETTTKKTTSDQQQQPDTQQVTVKFGRQESEMAKRAREKSYEFVHKKAQNEPWYDAMYQHDDTDYADLERLKLLSLNPGLGSQVSLGNTAYVKALIDANEDDVAQNTLDKCKQMLHNAKVLSYGEACVALRPCAASTVLSALTTVAVCVRGVWTLASDAVQWQSSRVPAATMAAARDELVRLLMNTDAVKRDTLAKVVRLPAAQLMEVLGSLCVRRGAQWSLIVPPDSAFEAAHPHLVHRYNRYWEGRHKPPHCDQTESPQHDDNTHNKKKRNRLTSSSSHESVK